MADFVSKGKGLLPSSQSIEREEFCFRVTGKQSIERLDPLVKNLIPHSLHSNLLGAIHKLDFVWETTCEKSAKEIHQGATVLNRLHNAHIIESKSNLAFLQQNIKYPMLETTIACGSRDVEIWAKRKWEFDSETKQSAKLTTATKANSSLQLPPFDWWVVKASKANGGRDVWILNESNAGKVLTELEPDDEYVIQRYVNNPLLYHGKKFHFRCYTAMMGDGTAMIYEMAFILCAGLAFDYSDDDARKHITNLSVNKRFSGHPGQVPCHLPTEYPQVFTELQKMWSAVVEAAMPYMSHQLRPESHFEFFGIDVIADSDGGCWFIEANRLPGLESSSNNKEAEDAMYDEMMSSFLRIILRQYIPADSSAAADPIEKKEAPRLFCGPHKMCGMWCCVRSAAAGVDRYGSIGTSSPSTSSSEDNAHTASPATWMNLLKWRAFTRKLRATVVIQPNCGN